MQVLTGGWGVLPQLRRRVDQGRVIDADHGGHSGGNDDQFARTIGGAVNPEYVVFSFGREQ